MNHLEENIGENLHDLWLGSGFLDITPKSTSNKSNKRAKIYKLHIIKITLLFFKGYHQESQNHTQNGKKNQINLRISDLFSEYIKNPYNSTISQIIKKWGDDLNRHFPKKIHKCSKGYIIDCSTSLDIREIQIKITMIYHFISIGWP